MAVSMYQESTRCHNRERKACLCVCVCVCSCHAPTSSVSACYSSDSRSISLLSSLSTQGVRDRILPYAHSEKQQKNKLKLETDSKSNRAVLIIQQPFSRHCCHETRRTCSDFFLSARNCFIPALLSTPPAHFCPQKNGMWTRPQMHQFL